MLASIHLDHQPLSSKITLLVVVTQTCLTLCVCVPNAGVHGFDPWLGKKPYMLATWLGQKFKNFVKSKQKKNDEGMKIMNRILSVVLLEKTAQAK